MTGSRGDSTTSGTYTPKAEFNADGMNVGFYPPESSGFDTSEPIAHWGGLGLGSSCSVGDPNCVTCYLDGFEHDCGQVGHLIDLGIAAQCPQNDCGPHLQTVDLYGKDGQMIGSASRFVLPGQPGWDGSFDGRHGVSWDGPYPYIARLSAGASSYAVHDVWLQTPESMRRRQLNSGEISMFRRLLNSTITGDCKAFLKEIMANIPGAYKKDLTALFEELVQQGGLFRQESIRRNGYWAGGLAEGNVADSTAQVTISFENLSGIVYNLIHELTHVNGGVGSGGVSHDEMAKAALAAAKTFHIDLAAWESKNPNFKLEFWDKTTHSQSADTHNSQVFQILIGLKCL